MNTTTHFLLIPVFALILAAASADLCATADYRTLCSSIVKTETNAALATATAIKATIAQLRNARFSAAIAEKNELTGMGRSNAGTCREVYGDAIDALRKALKNLRESDVRGLNSNLSAVMSDVVACGDGYAAEGFGGRRKVALGKVNERLRQLASNNLALALKVRAR